MRGQGRSHLFGDKNCSKTAILPLLGTPVCRSVILVKILQGLSRCGEESLIPRTRVSRFQSLPSRNSLDFSGTANDLHFKEAWDQVCGVFAEKHLLSQSVVARPAWSFKVLTSNGFSFLFVGDLAAQGRGAKACGYGTAQKQAEETFVKLWCGENQC